MWPLRIALSRLRPFNLAMFLRTVIVALLFALFVWGDFALFRRLFRAIAEVEKNTPLFALGILYNLLSLVFLVATVVLFSSALTAAIGSYFTDLDLDFQHAAPRTKLRIAISRWAKTFVQSAIVIFAFIIPMIAAFAMQYGRPASFYFVAAANLALLLSIPVTLASIVIVLLVRWFPVRRVHQIVATLAVLVLTLAVIAFRMSRPERLFADVVTDDVVAVLGAIELPAMEVYPGTALAAVMTDVTAPAFPPRIFATALVLMLVFLVIGRQFYFAAFVRARESMAPAALGAPAATRMLDRLVAGRSAPVRALVAKEVRTLSRDVAQWSQVFLMIALLFIYLYNIRMLPLGGDARAAIIAYANVGMAGFVVAAVCLRFAYPSVSSEGKAIWLLRSAPLSYRDLLLVKVAVYATPLTTLAVFLTAIANSMLDARPVVWAFTMIGSLLMSVTLVSLAVGMGALNPDFNAESPMQVGLSLGGFAYMALSLLYVGTIMFLMARPIIRYLLWRVLGAAGDATLVNTTLPIVAALALSAALAIVPLVAAKRHLTRLGAN